VRLFPEDGSFVSEDVSAAAQEPMRLSFAVEPDTRVRHFAAQAVAVVAELGAVSVAGGIASLAMGWPLLTACGAAALVYYPLATALTGRALSPAHLRSILKAPAGSVAVTVTPVAELADEPTPLYLVPRAATPAALAIELAADEFPQPRTAAR